MERILAADFSEHQKLPWISRKKKYYQMSGDFTVYSLPPVILLNDTIAFDDYVELDGTILFENPVFTDGIAYLAPEKPSPSVKGLFISLSPEALEYSWERTEATPSRLLLIEKDGPLFRIIASRCLSSGRALK